MYFRFPRGPEAYLLTSLSLKPNSAEGKYLRLALELGFKQEGCPFEFGNLNWLSGIQEEVDDKLTLLGSPDGEVSNPDQGPSSPRTHGHGSSLRLTQATTRLPSTPETGLTSSTASCRPRAGTSSRLFSGKGLLGRWDQSPCARCGIWRTSWKCMSSGPGRAVLSRRSPRRSEMGLG